MKIYFAGSIKGGRQLIDRYKQIIELMSEFGEVFTEHIADSKYKDNNPVHVYNRDMEWLRKADVMVAEVTVPSLGVGYEIGQAEVMGKPILCLFDKNSDVGLSFMIKGNLDVETFEYNNYEELKSKLLEFLNKFNSK